MLRDERAELAPTWAHEEREMRGDERIDTHSAARVETPRDKRVGERIDTHRAALEQASAHVGADADISQLVKTALALGRAGAPEVTASATRDTVGEDEMTKLATQALVQLGYPRPVAASAVQAASVHVGDSDLAALIKEALQRTRS